MMNKFTLEIDYDIMDDITRQNLQDAYRIAEDDEMRNAFEIAIRYFSNDVQYAKWVEEKVKYV